MLKGTRWSDVVEVSAYRSEDEPWRLVRLGWLVGWLDRLDDLAVRPARPQGPEKIRALHDHKGILTVTWASRPTRPEREYVEIGWETRGEVSVEHIVEQT